MTSRVLKFVVLPFAAWIGLALVMNGCVCVVHTHDSERPRPVYVKSKPPKPKKEAKPPKPSKKHVWVEGRWDYNDTEDDWEWDDGSWKEPPEKDAEWEKPQVEDRGEGTIIYTPGHWKNPAGKRVDTGKKKSKGKNTVKVRDNTVRADKPGKPHATPKKVQGHKKAGGVSARGEGDGNKASKVTVVDKKKAGGVSARGDGGSKAKTGPMVITPKGEKVDNDEKGKAKVRGGAKANAKAGVVVTPNDKVQKKDKTKKKAAIVDKSKKPKKAKAGGPAPKAKGKACVKTSVCNCDGGCFGTETKANCMDCRK